MRLWRGIIEEYREFIPFGAGAPIVTLLEGGTPLVPAPALARRLGVRADIRLKLEGANPTGSFKDRGMTAAITKAVADGARVVICASTGNTSASAAAYAARAGLRCVVVIPDGAIAMGKLAQAIAHGAEVVPIRGNFDQALAIVREMADAGIATLVNSVNPWRIEGQKTAAFEIVDQLTSGGHGAPGTERSAGITPDWLAIPVGNAGNITAYWKGFSEYAAAGRIGALPRMAGFEAAGAAPIVLGRPVEHPETIATAIRIGNPASWASARAAADDSGGFIDSVTDEEILDAYRLLAQTEGVFAEPASCACVAGLVKMARDGRLKDGQCAVAVLTGNGLKDPSTAIQQAPRVRGAINADYESVSSEVLTYAGR
ncbi:MAG TPA: threonine synthase [Bacillota bacterium]|nr:threonine synthase [Bacillota bacterium]